MLEILKSALPVIQIIGTAVVSSKLVTIFTPTQVKERASWINPIIKILNVVLRLLNTISLNVGKDKNKDG